MNPTGFQEHGDDFIKVGNLLYKHYIILLFIRLMNY